MRLLDLEHRLMLKLFPQLQEGRDIESEACVLEENVLKERTGKVFMVNRGMRTCLVCEQEFNRHEAAEHDKVPCYPATAQGRSIRSQNANR
jgi:hypothetical protein